MCASFVFGETMIEDIELAAKVHYSFLPEDYEDERTIVATSLRPLYSIGGDYCSILPLDKNRLLICSCDAVGHGISAALFAARINTFVLTHAHVDNTPCNLIEGLNAYLCKRLSGTGMYASFFALLFDFEAGQLCLAGAAHPPVLEFSLSSKISRRWPSSATYLGIMDPMPLSCDSQSVALSSGQRFLLYSDGLIEVEGADQELFGIERLSSAFASSGGDKGQKLNSKIFDQVINFSKEGFNDDVLLISIVIK